EKLLHENAVSTAVNRWRRVQLVLTAIGTDGPAGVAFVVYPQVNRKSTVGTDQFPVPAQKSRSHASRRDHIGFGRKRPDEQNAQAEEYQQFHSLTHHAGSGQPVPASFVVRVSAESDHWLRWLLPGCGWPALVAVTSVWNCALADARASAS